jgi:hypothetical protein
VTHDLNRQSGEFVREHQRKHISALSRRDLLKHVAVAGSMGVSGLAAGGVVNATEPPDPTTGVVDTDAETQFGKELTVKGVGTGVNEYHIETRGNTRLDEIFVAQDGTSDERKFDGSLRKGDSDSHFFTGRVTNVWTRGSITYSVSNHD